MQRPVLFSVVLGHRGAAPATMQALDLMVQMLPDDSSKVLWGITHSGRKNWDIIGAALDRGAKTVRVGFEDSNYVDENTTTTNNYDLVTKAVKVMAEHDCEPMTPEEARKLLHIGY